MQLTISQTNAAGSWGMQFRPERNNHHCPHVPLRDSSGEHLSGADARNWKQLPSSKHVPPNRKVLPLTASQPLLISKGNLQTGDVPLVTKAMLSVNYFILFFFFCFKTKNYKIDKETFTTTKFLF